MKEKEQKAAARKFAKEWENRGYEKGESQPFWLALLRNVYGIEEPEHYITFEEQVHIDHTSFIDGYISKTHVLIEQKGLGKNLNKPIKQSNGSFLNPYEQAKRYSMELPYSQRPRWIVTCNFSTFYIYDMEKPSNEPEIILLKNLEKEYYRLQFLVDIENEQIKKEMEVSIQAGEIIGIIYEALMKQYIDPSREESLKSLNMLCVRLVFCFYADKAGIFGKHNMFHDYLNVAGFKNARHAIIDLFHALDTPPEERDPYMEKNLAEFPYVNGGLFADKDIEIPQITEEIYYLLLEKACENFDWSGISPTIFGAVFESTLNPETRRSGGMHYTSIENIHKVINPLFLDDLQKELEDITENPILKTRLNKLDTFQEKLSKLIFLDPACGSGNFLTETYISLRRLENKVIKAKTEATNKNISGQIIFGNLGADFNPIKVTINQFYGIEINDFAVTVAKTALWIAESQMMKETENIIHDELNFLPLTSYANIIEGNALCLKWEDIVPKNKLNYIMGNPPFIGARLMGKKQKEDVKNIFFNWKNSGNLDYVSCWYKKAADIMKNTNICTALVSTNSIVQGENVANLWKPLFEQGVHIDFAYHTFRWDSEARIKAHVHCVIIGFSTTFITKTKKIFDGSIFQLVNNINAYLIDADNIFIESRTKPLCNVPEIGIGNKPVDGGNFLFTKDEMKEFINKEPKSEKWFKKWYGSQEFINQKPRYCLWLGRCQPNELRQMPECMKVIEAVQTFRQNSTSSETVKLANTPTRFHVENIPTEDYIVIPRVSSEKRQYIPIGFLSHDVLCSDSVLIIPGASLYHFGILTSNVHMAWVKTVCGRLEMRYRYSKDIVYNNFPWPTPSKEQRAKIERTSQAILNARALYPNSSLADLYNQLTMPPELITAHQQNDKAVMNAYGLSIKETTASICVAKLMKMYSKLAYSN